MIKCEKVEFEAFCKKFPERSDKRKFNILMPALDESFDNLSFNNKLQIMKNFKNDSK